MKNRKFVQNISIKLFLIFLLSSLCSCESKEHKLSDKLIGQWVIEEFQNNNKSLKFEYYVNVLSFKKNILKLPESRDSLIKTDNSNWELLLNKDKKPILKISSPDPSFSGNYKMDFFKNHERKLLGLRLDSEKTKLVLYKTMQNFNMKGYEWENE